MNLREKGGRHQKKKKLNKTMSWDEYCQAIQQLGFSKVTIVNRETYVAIAQSPKEAIATTYMDGSTTINENEELSSDWKSSKRQLFRFYGMKFKIVKRDESQGKWLIGERPSDFIVVRAFQAVWFIASARKKSDQSKTGFTSAQEAFDTINKELWSGLEGYI
ncbi:hypothetical protein RFI_09454 [Reticulomyxa filosa]|uniref:Profilin n=1 Tax=Reticulomyxa filosa TaxID=46433 RepID=X6NQP4_RETFI|nr:hypothetical protein RFI_09454 [Reticulomyxa filosa]|eukprot:ETO27682.1 hypothetical protein RFI_09454 [Reticulomyxa filosa]